MNAERLIEALALPPEVRVDQRVPKKLLLEQGAPTAADRRYLQDGVEELQWIAALKPSNIGIPAYRDDERDYLEIAVLAVTLRANAKAPRLVELIHRAVPYPVVLIASQGDTMSLSLAHKRLSRAELGKVVVEAVEATEPLGFGVSDPAVAALLENLALAAQPQADMLALYQGWIDNVSALAAARITGVYASGRSPEQAAVCREALADYARLEKEMASIRAEARKTKQMNRRVELNLELKRIEGEMAKSMSRLHSGVPE